MWCWYALPVYYADKNLMYRVMHCHIGFSITSEQLATRVKDLVASSAATGWANLGATIGALKGSDLRWANPLELKSAVENAFTERFGPKEAAKPKGGKVRTCC